MSAGSTIRRGINALQLAMWILAFGVLILLVLVVALKLLLPSTPPKQIEPGELVRQIDAGNVEEARVLRSAGGARIDGELRNPAMHFEAQIAGSEIATFTARLRAKGVPANLGKEIPRGSFEYYTAVILIILLFIGLFLFMVSRISHLRRRGLELKNKEVA